jgi:hypothetical protein
MLSSFLQVACDHVLLRLLGGDNIVSTQRDKWKVHRRVLHPAVSQKLYVGFVSRNSVS